VAAFIGTDTAPGITAKFCGEEARVAAFIGMVVTATTAKVCRELARVTTFIGAVIAPDTTVRV
jgi:hypothetical protein